MECVRYVRSLSSAEARAPASFAFLPSSAFSSGAAFGNCALIKLRSALSAENTFSGSRFNQPDSHRDWFVTSLWVFAMDALSSGLIVMVLGSYYMWFRFKRKRLRLGVLALAAGYGCCALFLRFMW